MIIRIISGTADAARCRDATITSNGHLRPEQRIMEEIANPEFAEMAQHWCETVLIWVGFGTLTGLSAKAIMPGRDPGGSVATLVMGIAGTLIGCSLLAYFKGTKISPITPWGFLLGTVGAFVLLFFYRFLGGYWFVEGDQGLVGGQSGRVRRSRRRARYANSHTE